MKKLFRAIYNVMPFKQGIFKMLRLFHLPAGITRHLVFNGVITLKMGDKRFKMQNRGYFLEQLFFWKGLDEWERYSSYLWRELSRRSDVVFDIGANTGVYTLMTKTINPGALVYAFEPVEKIYQILKANIAINGFQNAHAINKAVSSAEGTMDIYDVKDGNLYEASLEADYINTLTYDKNRFVKNSVQVDTVDHFMQSNGIPKLDLAKIDVETHEPKVLEGMSNCLRNSKPIMLIEILNQQVADGLKPFLETGDYVFYNINEETGYQKVATLNASSHFNYIVCPKEKENILLQAIDTVTDLVGKRQHTA